VSANSYNTGVAQPLNGNLPPGQGRRVRWVLAAYAAFSVLPIPISVVALLLGAVRSSMQKSPAVETLLMGALGVVAAVSLMIAMLWSRSQVVGDTIRSDSFRTVGLVLMVLGGGLMLGGGIAGPVAAFALRGALDALFAGGALAIIGVMGLCEGAVIRSVGNRAFVTDPHSRRP
jgi:hypothetical protein